MNKQIMCIGGPLHKKIVSDNGIEYRIEAPEALPLNPIYNFSICRFHT